MSSANLWVSPASAVGASFSPAVTSTFTVFAGESSRPSFTVSEKVSVVSAASCVGAVKVGFWAATSLSVTVGPAVWLHE